MNENSQSKWREELQRGQAGPESIERWRRELAVRGDEVADLEEELALEAALGQLSRVEVPSNFAARVTQAVEREERASNRQPADTTGWLAWVRSFGLVRHATVAVVLLATAFGWWQHRMHNRTQLAQELTQAVDAVGLPGVEALRDFEAIRLLRDSSPPPDDVALLTALSE